MTPTPRTDAAVARMQFSNAPHDLDGKFADFARELECENVKLSAEARTADGVKWSEISEMWRHKFEAAERELSDLQTKSAREVFAKGVYLGPRGTGSMPKQFAPEWWYNCFNKGYHDMSIFEIEWGYDAYLKYQKTKQ
jgi:hypothetical protein